MFFETKATREKWLDRFAVSNLPIDVFCEMNHIKKEMLIEILSLKRSKIDGHKKIVNISLYNVYSVYQSVILMGITFFYTFLIRWFYQL